MKLSVAYRLASVALLSCVIAGCQQATVINSGAGYQFVRFSDAKAARAASQDRTAGPAIAGNNAQCRKDQGCRK